MSSRANIVGAGVSGLASARALMANGWDVRLFEQSPGLPRAGTALGMWPEAMKALERLGLRDQVQAQAVRQQEARFLRPDGNVVTRFEPEEPVYLISRPALLSTLYQGISDDRVEWSHSVRDPASLPEGDLVIGADGINSRVRRVGKGEHHIRRPLGVIVFRGVVPGSTHQITETWGRGRLFGVTPQDSTSTNWFACVRQELLRRRGRIMGTDEALVELFGDWHRAVAGIVEAMRTEQIDRRRLYDSVPMRSMIHGRTAIIGDAAHAMAPNMGRGACEALIDAVSLADALRTSTALEEGLEEFNHRRLRQSRKIASQSRFLNRLSTGKRFGHARRKVMTMLASLS